MNGLTLDTLQADALRETANIGAGHAATALSQMMGATIMIKVPSIGVLGVGDVPARINEDEEPVAAVQMAMLGDLTGTTVLVFPKQTVMRMAEMMLRRPLGSSVTFTELETSAIKEAGNILSAAYMNALSELFDVTLLPSPPSLVIDMSKAVLRSTLGGEPSVTRSVLCVESEFQLVGQDAGLRGFFLLLPDPDALQRMLQAMRLG
jgi:chemotaxis protein CheC